MLDFMKHCVPSPSLVHKFLHFYKAKVILSLKFLAILLIILYQLTKLETPNYNTFRDILIASF